MFMKLKTVEKLIIPDSVNIISYFTSSFNISYNPDEESLCLGSYHIRNIGNQPITNPYLCIKLPEDSPFSSQEGMFMNISHQI